MLPACSLLPPHSRLHTTPTHAPLHTCSRTNSISERDAGHNPSASKSAAAAHLLAGGSESEDEEDILASKLVAVGREVKAASAVVLHDHMLFQVFVAVSL